MINVRLQVPDDLHWKVKAFAFYTHVTVPEAYLFLVRGQANSPEFNKFIDLSQKATPRTGVSVAGMIKPPADPWEG